MVNTAPSTFYSHNTGEMSRARAINFVEENTSGVYCCTFFFIDNFHYSFNVHVTTFSIRMFALNIDYKSRSFYLMYI